MHLWPSCIPLLSWQLQVLPPSASCLRHTSSPGSMQWFKEGRYTIMIRAATCKLGFARTVETRRGREGYPIAAVPPLTCRPLTPQLISRFIRAQLTAWVVPSTGMHEGHKFDLNDSLEMLPLIFVFIVTMQRHVSDEICAATKRDSLFLWGKNLRASSGEQMLEGTNSKWLIIWQGLWDGR